MNPLILSLAPSLIDLVRRFIPDKDKQLEAENAINEHVAAASDRLGEAMVADANAKDKFQSRWRPSLGWICVAGLWLDFILFPLTNMGRGLYDLAPIHSTLDAASLLALLGTLLGVGTMRTVEKIKRKN